MSRTKQVISKRRSKLKEWVENTLTRTEYTRFMRNYHGVLDLGTAMAERYYYSGMEWPDDKVKKMFAFVKQIRPEVKIEDLFYPIEEKVTA